MFAFNLVFPQLLPKTNSAELLGEQALLVMGSEGRGRAQSRVVAGASPALLFGCSHPCQGTGWPRQHTSIRSVHSEGWLVVLPAQPLAELVLPGACTSYTSKHRDSQG